MDGMDDSELWISGEEDEHDQQGLSRGDPTFFKLELEYQGESGDYHVRNEHGQKQRAAVSGFGSGSKRRPAFNVSCTAKAIIHGTLDQRANKPATLLVYDFCFFSYRSTRIKNADISFEFKPKKGSASVGPTVKKVAPFAKHVMMQTTETVTRKVTIGAGISGGTVVTANATANTDRSVEKTTTHAAEIIGNNPFDDWGNYFLAQWSLKENNSQENGIVSLLRTCILLTRDNDEEFYCIPSVTANPNFTTWLGTLLSSRTPDDPILLDPEYDPYNVLEQCPEIDRRNLGAVILDDLWDCTFHKSFGEAVKESRTLAASEDAGVAIEKLETVTESKSAVP